MKIILSRKGFDSANGGCPSPILPDNKMVSFLIPSDDYIKYSDLKIDDEYTYFDLIKQLKLKSKIRYNNKPRELTKDTKCHLDPDMCKGTIKRSANWQPCFGQIDSAQTHLSNEMIKENDLFLFFGWFKKTILKNGILQFDKSASDLHIIFGYLQIGKILPVNNDTIIPDWLKYHPHVEDKNRKKKSTNTIYIAKENLSFDKNKPGADVFKYNDNLVLTKKGFSRSRWELPDFFRGLRISYHSDESWNNNGYFQSVPIGQEFVIEDNDKVANWAKQLINNN